MSEASTLEHWNARLAYIRALESGSNADVNAAMNALPLSDIRDAGRIRADDRAALATGLRHTWQMPPGPPIPPAHLVTYKRGFA